MIEQDSLFDDEPPDPEWKQHWQDMPEFVQEQQRPYAQLVVRFRNQEDLDDFAKRIGQKLNARSQSTWHPELPLRRYTKRYVDESEVSGLHSIEGPLAESIDQSATRANEGALSDCD